MAYTGVQRIFISAASKLVMAGLVSNPRFQHELVLSSVESPDNHYERAAKYTLDLCEALWEEFDSRA